MLRDDFNIFPKIKNAVQDALGTAFFIFTPYGSRTRDRGLKNDFDVKIVVHISVFDTQKYVSELKSFRGTLPNPNITFQQLVHDWLLYKLKDIPKYFLLENDEYGNPVKVDLTIELKP